MWIFVQHFWWKIWPLWNVNMMIYVQFFSREKEIVFLTPLKRKGLTIIFQLKFTSTTLPLHKEQNNFNKRQIFNFIFQFKDTYLKVNLLLILEHSKSEICLFTNWFCSPCIWWQPRTFTKKFSIFRYSPQLFPLRDRYIAHQGHHFWWQRRISFLALRPRFFKSPLYSSRQSISGLGRLGARADLQIIFYKINSKKNSASNSQMPKCPKLKYRLPASGDLKIYDLGLRKNRVVFWPSLVIECQEFSRKKNSSCL